MFNEWNIRYDESSHDGRHIAHLDIALRILKTDYPLDKVARNTHLTPEKLFEVHERVRTKAQKAWILKNSSRSDLRRSEA